VKHLLIK